MRYRFFVTSGLLMRKITLFDGSSELNRYKIIESIYDGRHARVLYSGHKSPQSGMALDDDPELLFDYNQRFLEMVESARPASVLLIGGGAFTLPKVLLERFNDIRVDVVEIDPLLPQLARQYFDLPDDPRLNIIIGDGRQYIDTCQVSYDMIIIDAFFKYDISMPLLDITAVQNYRRCLSEYGIVAINFIARYHTYKTTLAHRLVATFQSVFSTVELYPADHDYHERAEQNLIMVASQQDMITLDYLQSVPVSLLFMPDNVILDGNS
ncbi:MAG: fused MFS/spermidine synthase [Candidatus Saccharimonadales bacterium]